MRFVNPNDGGLPFPAASVASTQSADGALLETGWLVSWPGPGYVYLSDGDLVDVMIPGLAERPAVQEAARSAGWTAPGETAPVVAALEEKIAALEAELAEAKAVQAGFEAALKKLEHAHKAPAKKKAAT